MIRDYIDNQILKLCRQPRTFEFISKNLSGFEPTQTLLRLNNLSAIGSIVDVDGFWVIREMSLQETPNLYPNTQKHYFQKYMGYFDFLKTPHPLDFEWRNSTESLNMLIGKINEISQPEDRILILGMPTLFATAIQRDIPNHTTLIERNRPIVEGLNKLIAPGTRFKVLQEDIFVLDPTKIASHQCVIMDPPWYTPHFQQFMWLAAQSTFIGGLVAISLPPINTRPSISKERIEWFSFCEELGLCLESLEPQLLHYAMPFFEFNAFRASGITNVNPFWRKGDFAVFRKIQTTHLQRPSNELVKNEWVEREYKSVRFRIRVDNNQNPSNHDLSIESIIKADILPTISSRDTRKDEANIWTSGNRIFKTNDPPAFIQSFDNLAKDIDDESLEGSDKLVYDFIELIANFESGEYKNYMDWIYYEMERQII